MHELFQTFFVARIEVYEGACKDDAGVKQIWAMLDAKHVLGALRPDFPAAVSRGYTALQELAAAKQLVLGNREAA